MTNIDWNAIAEQAANQTDAAGMGKDLAGTRPQYFSRGTECGAQSISGHTSL